MLTMPARTYIYSTYAILPPNRCWACTQGAAGRPPPYNGTLMHDSAQTHTRTLRHTHTHKSVKHVVLQTAPATWDRAAPCSLYKKHGSKRVCTIVCCTSLFLCDAALVQKGTWKNHRGCEAEAQRKFTRWAALTVLVVAFRPSVPARQHAFCQPGRPCSCGEER